MKTLPLAILTIFVLFGCIKVSQSQDGKADQSQGNRLSSLGMSVLRNPEATPIDKMKAKENARSTAVYMVQGFEYQYLSEGTKTTLGTRGKGEISTHAEGSYETIKVGEKRFLLCRQAVAMDAQLRKERTRKLKDAEKLNFQLLLSAREARTGVIKECITRALKKHFEEKKVENDIRGYGWLGENMDIKKVSQAENEDMLEVSFSLNLLRNARKKN